MGPESKPVHAALIFSSVPDAVRQVFGHVTCASRKISAIPVEKSWERLSCTRLRRPIPNVLAVCSAAGHSPRSRRIIKVISIIVSIERCEHPQLRRMADPSIRATAFQTHVVSLLRSREPWCEFRRNKHTSAGSASFVWQESRHVDVSPDGPASFSGRLNTEPHGSHRR